MILPSPPAQQPIGIPIPQPTRPTPASASLPTLPLLPLTPPNSCSAKNTLQFPSSPASPAILAPNPLSHESPSLSDTRPSPSPALHRPAGSPKSVPLDRPSTGPLSPPPNSIKFPSASPTPTLADSDAHCDGPLEPGPAFAHWLAAVYEPAPAPPSPSIHTLPPEPVVPEIDILIGCKAITDQLGLPPLSRAACLDILLSQFPLVSPWARPTPPGIRANQEFVLRGLKYRSTYGARAQEDCTRAPADQADQPTPFSWDTINIHQPIPSRHHTPSLIEAMRVRICTLERQLGRLRVSSLLSTTSCPKLDPELANTRQAQSDHVDALERVGSRIWGSLIRECQMAADKLNLELSQKKTISWTEELTLDEFKLIARHSRRMGRIEDAHRLTIAHPLVRTSTGLFGGRAAGEIDAALVRRAKSTRIKKLRVKSLNILKSSGYAISGIGVGLGGGGTEKIEKKKKTEAEGVGGKVTVLEISISVVEPGSGMAQIQVMII